MEKEYTGYCSKCKKATDLIFDKDNNGEPIYSTEGENGEGLSDLLATGTCECGNVDRVIIYGKARLVEPIIEENKDEKIKQANKKIKQANENIEQLVYNIISQLKRENSHYCCGLSKKAEACDCTTCAVCKVKFYDNKYKEMLKEYSIETEVLSNGK
jgi:hypothetical protein